MSERAEGVRVAYPLFQAGGGGSTPTSALDLRIHRMRFEEAKALNRLWHSRLPRYGNPRCTVSYGGQFDGIWFAVAIWSNPVARLLPQQTWLELRRLAVAPDAPRNTASRMLAVMTRLIRSEFPDVVRLVSYHDTEVHTGGIYRAAGWQPVEVKGSQTKWGCPSRPRTQSQSEAPKQRWEKVIR